MSIETELLETLRTLPPEKRGEVLDFARFIGQHRRPTPRVRPIELCEGEFAVPADFDAILPEEVLKRSEQ